MSQQTDFPIIPTALHLMDTMRNEPWTNHRKHLPFQLIFMKRCVDVPQMGEDKAHTSLVLLKLSVYTGVINTECLISKLLPSVAGAGNIGAQNTRVYDGRPGCG